MTPRPPKAIILNGPPRSGKDTLAEGLRRLWPSTSKEKFAQPIVDYMFSNWGVLPDLVDKSLPPPGPFKGPPVRQIMIAYSEQFMKPLFGKDIFGKFAVRRIERTIVKAPLYIFSDGGFSEEIQCIVDYLGAENVGIVHLMRPGTSFDGDSRDWVTLPNVETFAIQNRADLSNTRDPASKIVETLQEQEEFQRLLAWTAQQS